MKKELLAGIGATAALVATFAITSPADARGGASPDGNCGCSEPETPEPPSPEPPSPEAPSADSSDPSESNGYEAAKCGAQHFKDNLYLAWATGVNEPVGNQTIIAVTGNVGATFDKFSSPTIRVVGGNKTTLRPLEDETLEGCALRAVGEINNGKTTQNIHSLGSFGGLILKHKIR